jgi:hypothetical protein
MLLQCELCQTICMDIAKVPCGFFIEKDKGGNFTFVMPQDEECYRNICIGCLFNI